MAGYIGSNQPTNLSNTSADIDGTVTADGLVVEDADGATIRIQSSDTSVDGGSLGQLEFYSNDASTGGTGVKGKIQVTDTSSFGTAYEMNFFTGYVTGGAHAETKKMSIGPFGDISFYEDTGTTAKLFWDASAESLGIGTSSPSTSYRQEISMGTSGLGGIYITSSNNASVADDHINITAGRGATNAYNFLNFTNSAGTMFKVQGDGNVGIGTSSPSQKLHVQGDAQVNGYIFQNDGTNAIGLWGEGNADMRFGTNNSEAMRIDSSGNLLVGTTSTSASVVGGRIFSGGRIVTSTTSEAHYFRRNSTDGSIVDFAKDGTTVGSIGSRIGNLYVTFTSNGYGLTGTSTNNGIIPSSSGSTVDNVVDLGNSGVRFDDIYATNGTIQTSDQNEKQQIASLTDAEITAAKAISKLFKTFKWNDSVAEKGDAARTHSGVIAQEVEQAMTDAGLNAGDYAFFISTTWWETQTEVPAVEAVAAQDAVYEDVIIPAVEEVLDEEGNVVTEAQPERTEQRLVSEAVEAVEGKEAYTRTDTYDTAEEAPEGATERNRKGIRYPQLLSFIGAATEQRLASIESRLDALESA